MLGLLDAIRSPPKFVANSKPGWEFIIKHGSVSFQLIKAPDQLLPLMMMKVIGHYPGMAGLFIAGIFSAALSTLSTCLNAMAAIVLEDFCKPFVKTQLTERQTNIVMRGTVLLVGIISASLVFVVEHLGTVLQLSISLSSMAGGPIFGLFTMGLICPWVKKRVCSLFLAKTSFESKFFLHINHFAFCSIVRGHLLVQYLHYS